MNQTIFILLAGQQGDGGSMSTFLMLGLLIVVFWMFFIRPQMKKTKELNKFRQNMQKNQKIITIGGIHGKIIEIQDTTVIIETEGQNRLKLEKSAIAAEFNPEQLGEKK
jgi:preprotein translocase subunit YajC